MRVAELRGRIEDLDEDDVRDAVVPIVRELADIREWIEDGCPPDLYGDGLTRLADGVDAILGIGRDDLLREDDALKLRYDCEDGWLVAEVGGWTDIGGVTHPYVDAFDWHEDGEGA